MRWMRTRTASELQKVSLAEWRCKECRNTEEELARKKEELARKKEAELARKKEELARKKKRSLLVKKRNLRSARHACSSNLGENLGKL